MLCSCEFIALTSLQTPLNNKKSSFFFSGLQAGVVFDQDLIYMELSKEVLGKSGLKRRLVSHNNNNEEFIKHEHLNKNSSVCLF